MQDKNKNINEYALKLIKACPVCGQKFTEKEMNLVEKEGEQTLIYFSCNKCSSSLLANISEMPMGLIGSAVITDLELNEVQKFKNAEPISADDVLEVHKGLRNKD